MTKKYHWSYEAAMEIVDRWAEEHGISLPMGQAYESLVQSFAEALERQHAEGKSEGLSESHDRRERYRPRPWYGDFRGPTLKANSEA